MRLGQLSRKIGVQQSSISSFLIEKNYTLEAGSNSKLTEEQEELIKTHFDYVEEEVELTTDILETAEEAVPLVDIADSNTPINESVEAVISELEEKEEAVSTVDNLLRNVTPASDVTNVEEAATPADLQNESELNTEETDDDDVIRAPKLKLDGLKVVGKIDLPEPKVTEAIENNDSQDIETSVEEVKEKPVRKKIIHRNNNRKPQKRVWSLEEKRARDEKIKKRKNKERKEEQKLMKTAHYESKMRERKNTSRSKKSKRKNINNHQHQHQHQEKVVSRKPEPKSLFGKFMRWLNT